jgi:hypothetical protein
MGKKYSCVNDGYQFHMTKLELTQSAKTVLVGSPYNTYKHSTYRLGGETEDIQQYNLTLSLSGKSWERVHAEVIRRYNSRWESLATGSSTDLVPTKPLTIQGSMNAPLTIARYGDCKYQITYRTRRPRFFTFLTTNGGFGDFSNRTAKLEGDVKYCDTVDTPAVYKPRAIPASKTIRCTFPAW